MAATFDAATLGALRTTEEVGIRTSHQPDRAIIIWVVVTGNDVFVRSVRASKGQWYEAAATDGRATLEFADRQIPVRVLPVGDAMVIGAVSAAYLAKYAASPYAKEMVRAETLPTTLRLVPLIADCDGIRLPHHRHRSAPRAPARCTPRMARFPHPPSCPSARPAP